MSQLQFDGLTDQFRATGEVTIVAQDEPGQQETIFLSHQAWHIRASVDFVVVPKRTHKLIFEVFLEGMSWTNQASASESNLKLSDEQEWLPQKQHYDFQVSIGNEGIPIGLYRISALMRLQDTSHNNLVTGYADVGIIQIYSES